MIMNYDGEQILFLDRPLSMTNIKKISENDFPIFVNDLMCEKGTGHLLFPASFRNQVNLYLKQQSYAYKVTTFNKNKNFIEMMKELKRKRNKELYDITNMKKLTSPKLSNLKKREELEEMKVNLNSLKNRRSKLIKNLRNKNKKFYKSQPLINRKLRKLMFQSVNDIRIRGYEKAFEACNNLSLTHKDFNMPDISVNEFTWNPLPAYNQAYDAFNNLDWKKKEDLIENYILPRKVKEKRKDDSDITKRSSSEVFVEEVNNYVARRRNY